MIDRCKKYTPLTFVDELLNVTGYNENLYGRTVLENSCGTGNILKGVVRRYIEVGLKMGIDREQLKMGLEQDVCGVELDSKSIDICKTSLSKIAEEYGIKDVYWHIIQGNYLRLEMRRKFDYIIANPPYIVYRDIPLDERDYIKNRFLTCSKGKCDYYYAFIEKGIEDLSSNGRMTYILPDGLYKNIGASELRQMIRPYVSEIVDYTKVSKFPDAITSSTILRIDNVVTNQIKYTDASSQLQMVVPKEQLQEKWSFLPIKESSYRFGDYYTVTNTVATLYNKAFLLENYSENEQYLCMGEYKIEKTLVKKALSRRRGANRQLAIIFPYGWEKGTIRRYTEEEMERQFPFAYNYLLQYKEKLGQRASDKNIKWFEYGRSQALSSILSDKLVIPSIESNRIKVTRVGKDTISLAGFFITARTKEHTLSEAKRILEGEQFFRYLQAIGTHTTGNSKRISVKDIMAYSFNEWV